MLFTKNKGLYTYPNPVDGDVPDGSMLVAKNICIRRPDIAEPRRGLNPLTGTFPSGGTGDAGTVWIDTVAGKTWIVVHTTMNKVAYVDTASPNGSWVEFSGTYTPPTGQTMRFTNANKNLYFTTSSGVFKIDTVANTPAQEGAPKGINFTSAQTGLTGFQVANSQVGYRVVWAIRDANTNLIVGVPAGRVIQLGTANPTASTAAGVSRAASTVTVVTAAAHPYVVGDVVYLLSTDTAFPSGNKTIATVADNTHFTYTEAGSATTSTVAQNFYYATRNTSLVIQIPTGITTSHFLQVYRTAQSADYLTDPGEEMGLVLEYSPNNKDLTNGSITATDTAIDAMRGATIYTAPSQGGILQGAERAPLANDIAAFRGCIFAAKTKQPQRIILTLLSTNVVNIDITQTGIASGDKFALDGTNTITGGASESGSTFKVFTSGTVAQNIENTARSIVATMNRQASPIAYAYYVSGPDDPPGRILIEAASLATAAWAPYALDTLGTFFSPNLAEVYPLNALSRTSNLVTATITSGRNVNLIVGQQVVVQTAGTPSAGFPNGAKTVVSTAILPDTPVFTYTEAGSNGTSGAGYQALVRGAFTSANVATLPSTSPDSATNAIFFTPPGQPESWPLLQNLRTPDATATVLRIIAMRDRLFVFTDDGLYAISGSDPSNFRLDPIDQTLKLLSPNSAVKLNNMVYLHSNQGIARVSEYGGTEIISMPIDGDIASLVAANISQVKAVSFGVGYESDRSYQLWITSSSDTAKAAQSYYYNYATDAWTGPHDMPAKFGLVDSVADVMYIGDATLSTLRQERKNLNNTDYADGTVAVTVNSSSGASVTLASSAGVNIGDLLFQGALKSIITNVVGNVLTVADSLAWSNAAATVYLSFQCQVQYTQGCFGDAGAMKEVTRATWLMADASFNTATVDYASDLSASYEGSTINGTSAIGGTPINTPIASPIPQEKHLCSQLFSRFTIRNAYGSFKIVGRSIAAKIISDRTVR